MNNILGAQRLHTHTRAAALFLPKGGCAGLSCCPPTLWKGGLRRFS